MDAAISTSSPSSVIAATPSSARLVRHRFVKMVLAVCFACAISNRVVVVRFDVAGRKISLCDTPKCVIGERGVVVRVLDAGQIVFRIVAIGRDVIRGVAD
jgi:hypothetical protein